MMPVYADTTPPILAHASPAWGSVAIAETTHYARAHYASVADMARALEAPPAWHLTQPSANLDRARRPKADNPDFYGRSPFNDARGPSTGRMLRLFTEGWPEGARIAADAAARLSGALAATPRLTRRSIAGGRPLVALAVAGDPRHMLTRAPAPRGTRTLDLCVALGGPARIDASAMAASAIIAAAMCDRLEAAGYRVALTGCSRSTDEMTSPCRVVSEMMITLKEAHETADAGTLAVTAGHPWMARHAVFIGRLQDQTCANNPCLGGYQGYNQQSYRPRSAENPNAPLLLPEAMLYADALKADRLRADLSPRSLARCLAIAVDSLNAQGEGDPLAPRLDPVAWQEVGA